MEEIIAHLILFAVMGISYPIVDKVMSKIDDEHNK